MRRHLRKFGLTVGVLGLLGLAYAAYVGWFHRPPQLARAAEAAEAPRVVVGPNVQVSGALGTISHQGCTIAADPSNPRRLFAASMHQYLGGKPDGSDTGVVGYRSDDGGATWRLATERRGERLDERVGDEAVAFGPDGALYLGFMRLTAADMEAARHGDPAKSKAVVEFHRSADGGATWQPRAVVRQNLDRPQLAADLTGGPFRGRLYCNGDLRLLTAAFFASADEGRTMEQARLPGRPIPTSWPGNPVVLPDGTVVVTYCRAEVYINDPPTLPVLRSTDGGRTFAAAGRVATAFRHARVKSNQGLAILYPLLAAAPAGGVAAGRLYCVWHDGWTSDERYILLSSSDDKGATWTPPVVVSEQPLGADAAADWQVHYPAIAVNKDGVVAVSWYDRRGLSKAEQPDGSIRSTGYNVRLRASADGGKSWGPSVLLSEAPGRGDLNEVRGWAGMAAAADGRFHPAWVSDATGVRQVWTAAVEVSPGR